MSTSGPVGAERSSGDLSHIDLLGIARAVQHAVIEDDTDEVHALLCRLRADLVTHLHAERQRLLSGQGSLDRVVLDGQRRLMTLLEDVIAGMGDGPGECNCLVRAAEIEIALRRQARLEATVFDRRPVSAPPVRRGR